MFNSTYVRGGNATNNNNIEINSVTGTLVKNYRKSFFFKCKEDSDEARMLFDPQNPKIQVKKGTNNCIEEKEWSRGDYIYHYYKNVVVLQTMILANGMLLNEVIWQDDFDNMFSDYNEGRCSPE